MSRSTICLCAVQAPFITGGAEILVGELEVERVMDNLSIGKVMPGWLEDEVIRKGDRAVLKKEEEGASGI